MKATVFFHQSGDVHWASIQIKSNFIEQEQLLVSKSSSRKGEIKRQVIQFCAALNLDVDFI